MPRHREFGISELLLTLVIVPLVSVVILNKWKKNRAARKAEIKKLLLLAADEAARVEAEAAAEYTYATAVNRYQCAVCFSPTTTRCSRCKAVRYCSGKCQIIHWRQGHKQDCQPPDINGSTASVSCISTTRSALDSTLYESQELRSSESNLQGTRTSASTNKKAYHYISEKPEFSTSEAPQASTSPEATVEISGPEGVNVIEPVLDTIQTSSVDHKALDSTIQKESRISDVPIFDNSVSDVPCSYNGYSLNNLSSDALTSRDANSDVRKFETPESDVHSSNSVNNIFSSKVCTPNLPIPKNHTICHPVSSISLDNHPGSSSSENGHHNSTSLTSQMPDLPSKGKIPPISKDPVHDLLTSKSSLRHSSSPSRRVVDASGRLHPSFVTNTHVVDAPISRSSGKDILRSEVSVTNSVGQSSSVSNVSSLSSLPTTDDPSTFTCTNTHAVDAPVSRSSGKISKVSATNSVSQSSSVSNVSSSNSSLPTSTCSKFEGPASSEVSNKTPAPQIDSPMTSVSNGTSRRSVRTVFQHSSPHRERASVRTISRQKTGSSETVSSNAFQTVVSSLNASNSLKASVKKVAQQLKSSKSSKQNAAKSINEGVGKSSKVLFSYDYFVKLFNWDKLDVPPCGLINCGNSCYANAVLQCLTFTRPIAAYLLQGSHSKNCQRKDWCFMCELEHLVSRVREGKSPISPISILSQIQNIGNHLGYGREEDAHEFLRFAIDTMQSVCLDEAGGEKAVNSRIQETTLIQQTFGGYLQSKIKCLKCQHVSERYENMMDLTVEIQGNIESLQDALTQFTASEILDGENKYKCDRCKSYVKAIKQLTVHEAPNILTIALKRFQTGKFGKLNKRVMFPEVLNMKPYMSGTGDKPPLYKLYAVVVHLDMMNASFSGHYVCYVKNLQGTWYKTDDCKVKQVELDRVLSQGAYMLLYSRSSPRSPPITKNGTVNSSTTLNVVPCTKAAKQPLLNHGQERIGVLDPQFSPLASCTVNFEDFGFNYDRAPSFIGNRRMDSTPLSYADLTSSDSGSLFSCSDEASCSTESNRDSTSTDDYVETVFGDSGRLTSNGCGLLEDSYPMSNSFLCMKSSPCPPQTEYYFENDSYFRESELSNLQLSDNIHHGRRKSDQGFSSLPNPPPLDTDGLPAWFSNSASSYFFPPSIQSSHVESCCFDSDPSSRHSDWLDNRTTNTNEYSDSLKSQNSVWAPDVSETGAYNISEDFAAPAKSQYVKEKYMLHIIKESERSNFDASSRPHNIVTNFDYCLVHDMRTSDTPTFQSFGLKR